MLGKKRVLQFEAADASRRDDVLHPCNWPPALGAKCEECALLGSRKRYEKRIYLFSFIWLQAPPGPIIEPVKDHCVEFQTLALMNGHQRDLIQAFKFIQDF